MLARDGGQYLLFMALCAAVLARAVTADARLTWGMLASSIVALLILVAYVPLARTSLRNRRGEVPDLATGMNAVPLESPDQ